MGFLSSVFRGLNLLNMLYSLPAIIVALSFHECAHAYVAYRCGDPTARNLGRMTLNPFKHLDPMGFICLLFFGFGWARPVPVNPRNFRNLRRDDTLVSLAGITANLILAILSMLATYIYAALNGNNMVIANVLFYLVIINISLMIFNLIPVPPLDGSHVLENLLIKKVGPRPFLFMQRYSTFFLIGILGLARYTGVLSQLVYWIVSGLDAVLGAIFTIPGFYMLP
ncbi:MAG: site-2 protease family protein [Clostridiales bacterium]|jgi:Zn-dependent protease|nr:site-2 protease family protein [Clostridiales bacterium]